MLGFKAAYLLCGHSEVPQASLIVPAVDGSVSRDKRATVSTWLDCSRLMSDFRGRSREFIKAYFCHKTHRFLPLCVLGNRSKGLLLPILCKPTDLPTASRPRSDGTSLKSHCLNPNHHHVYRHVDTIPFLSKSHHPLCDNAVHVRAPYALPVRIARLDNFYQMMSYHNHHYPKSLHSHRQKNGWNNHPTKMILNRHLIHYRYLRLRQLRLLKQLFPHPLVHQIIAFFVPSSFKIGLPFSSVIISPNISRVLFLGVAVNAK